jgi:hypothetical protein
MGDKHDKGPPLRGKDLNDEDAFLDVSDRRPCIGMP